MSFDLLKNEIQTLNYEEQITLMAFLANSIQSKMEKLNNEKSEISLKLKALDSLSDLYTPEEVKKVDESIRQGIKIEELSL